MRGCFVSGPVVGVLVWIALCAIGASVWLVEQHQWDALICCCAVLAAALLLCAVALVVLYRGYDRMQSRYFMEAIK